MGAGLLPAEQQNGDQPSAMLALSQKGEYKGATLRYSVCYHSRKEKRGAHAVYSAVFCLCMARSGVSRFFDCSAHRAFSAAVSAEKIFTPYFFILL